MMNTVNIIKRAIAAGCVMLTLGLATVQAASASVNPNNTPRASGIQ